MWGALTGRTSVRCWLLLAVLASFMEPALAQANGGLVLEEAIARTLAGNPSLASFDHQRAAQQGRIAQSQIKPAPDVGVAVENAVGSGLYSGIDSAETTLSLGWILERGKREQLVGVAKAEGSALESQLAVQRVEAVAATARLFLDTLEYQERQILAEEAIALAEKTAEAVAQQVRAGKTPIADRARAEAGLARARLAAEDVEHELATVRQQLATQWGHSQPDFDRVFAPWQTLPTPDSFESLLAKIDQSPTLALFLSEQRLREAELRLAQSRAKPDWRVDVGVRRLELTDDHSVQAGISIPLSGQRNAGLVAEAQANLALVDSTRTVSRLRVESQLYALYQALQHSLHREEMLREDVIPTLENAVAQTQRGYDQGRNRFYELQQLQAELLAARTEWVAASIAAHRNLIEIERLTGTVMPLAVPSLGEEK
jgi:cobalt-zinc-cadmium efflux system outer membrane protein